ncbi:hypothetical protein [Streptomyces katrae]|uniref:hypothetical protein n=1 Tax=Streptomyces katrae TaxID=68223 RepID=UPI0004C00EE9|nr:hypothetical protein [Streptomyces katrae]
MSTATVERTELARFLTIAGQRHRAGYKLPEMFSGAIDAFWHEQLDAPTYDAFSTEHAGAVVGHNPTSGSGAIEWVAAYEEAYGPLPAVWFTDERGRLDGEAFAAYRESGRVEASWNCGPEFAEETAE